MLSQVRFHNVRFSLHACLRVALKLGGGRYNSTCTLLRTVSVLDHVGASSLFKSSLGESSEFMQTLTSFFSGF